ncbi:MAG: sensor domain-containing diguanylate cyclase [Clostridium sp.]
MSVKNKIRRNKFKMILLPIAVFCVTIICFGLFIYKDQTADIQATRDQVQYITDSQVRKLEAALTVYLNNTKLWEMLVIETDAHIENFEEIAAELYDNDPAVRSIQLAPAGVVTQVYPLKGNEEAFGDLFADPDRKTEAEYARDSGKMTLAGPFDLYQGGKGLVARNPVYLKNSDNKLEFWGFTIVVLNVPEIFESADLGRMKKEGYEYKLWRTHPDKGDVQIITESSNKALDSPTQFSFEVPNSTWTFGVEPVGGWVNINKLTYQILVALLLSFLLALIAWMFAYQNEQKNRMTSLSYIDSLTSLYNSRKCLEMLHDYQDRKQPFGIIYLDLNKFKQINDIYGHDIGNDVLIAVGVRLQNCINERDTAFRLGGDEFLVLVFGQYTEEFYHNMIVHIKQSLSREIKVGNLSLYTSASAGYARYPDDDGDFEKLIQKADAAMYDEKSRVFSHKPQEPLLER